MWAWFLASSFKSFGCSNESFMVYRVLRILEACLGLLGFWGFWGVESRGSVVWSLGLGHKV